MRIVEFGIERKFGTPFSVPSCPDDHINPAENHTGDDDTRSAKSSNLLLSWRPPPPVSQWRATMVRLTGGALFLIELFKAAASFRSFRTFRNAQTVHQHLPHVVVCRVDAWVAPLGGVGRVVDPVLT